MKQVKVGNRWLDFYDISYEQIQERFLSTLITMHQTQSRVLNTHFLSLLMREKFRAVYGIK
jgi:hypothetical protein